MKKISFLISQKEKKPSLKLEDKDIFYLFERIIKQEYGNQGAKNLKAGYYKNGKLYIKSESSIFSNELLLNKKEIVRKLNQEIGNEEIVDIKVN
ncbi:MAG: DciA family protein [Parcubacteria group bacterium]|jgi:CMP-N-acetylneuraminic acid synthetase